MKRNAYKVMCYTQEENKITAGANSNLTYDLNELLDGKPLEMPGNGCYVAPNKEYVLDYYSGLAENEVLLKFEYDDKNIITGNINDQEPEISISSLKLIEAYKLDEGEVVCKIEPIKNKTSKVSKSRKNINKMRF